MSHPPETRVCPICHSLLWEEDFLRPEDLETWEPDERSADNGRGADPEAALLELAELLLELFLTLDAER